ncbi:MAG: NADPH:quinone reductase [Bryobacterales bacterium]|jgi:NADPH:quinone reductase-like Zn-dependent oxidoreductase|nr:NADPH:quinone reductase [Bryobacterales bacterium]
MSVETKNHSDEKPSGDIEIPETMPAAAIDGFGGPEVLTLHKAPVPVVDKGEVLIPLDTAGVGKWDAEMRDGWVSKPAGEVQG